MPRRKKHHWLFKSEPDVYSIQDLERDGETYWEGVRNYQARNLLRDEIRQGDGVLFYHSRVKPMGVAGLATVSRSGYPDPDQFDPKAKYHDPKSDPDDPRWYCVDLRFDRQFPAVVELATLKADTALQDMMVVQRGARLSIQPVTKTEWDRVLKLARGG